MTPKRAVYRPAAAMDWKNPAVRRAVAIHNNMKQRCYNANNISFKYYGARGVTVCDEWKLSSRRFVYDMGLPPEGYTLDRCDPNGSYKPDNCRWADRVTQGRNKTNNNIVEYEGRSQCVAAWAEELGIPMKRLSYRINAGMPIEEALSDGRIIQDRIVTYKGEKKHIEQWGKDLGIAPSTLHSRIFKGNWSIEKAFTTPVRNKRRSK